VARFSTNFEEFLKLAHGNFKDQNKVLEFSTMIITYSIITNNPCYNYINNASYNSHISHKGVLQVCVKEENLEVTGAANTFCMKRRL
jgi:hypothetical protein